MKTLRAALAYFSKTEKLLWSISALVIVLCFVIFDRSNYLSLAAALIGVTSLIFCAKGNPVGQLLMIVFGLFYGIISFRYAYYGEMVTYLGMTVPMAVIALVAWLRHPYRGNRAEVEVNRLSKKELFFMLILAAVVTGLFYFILKWFRTANLIPSTLSVTTSFIAVYLTFRRSPYYALAYAANDLVLIVLWVLASREDITYLSVVVCFMAFLANDIYGFLSWRAMEKRQTG
ncbi:nicotinamide riboside transporter PnuC [Ruminococcus sp.]|uniref:nicotinamide riboside transporter PnuC n=1 Tax=Ruminococcus sp. TaxID=41978 RepID=UPI00388E54DB